MDRSKQSISLINVNTQSICAKKLEFQLMVEDTKPDVIVACETWLKPAVNCSEFMPSGYDPPFRKDRADGYGGVMIAIKTGLTAEQLMIPTPCELVAVKLKTPNTPLIVIGIYRPTDNNTDYSTSTCDAISSIARKFPNNPLWITGDINLPDIQWKTNTVTKHQYTKQINEHFLDTFSMLGLSQMVTFPTRLDNTLDVFLTNRPSLVNSCEPVPGISDHDAAVYIHSDILPKRHRHIQRTIHVWRKADNRLIHDELATFADEIQKDHNLDTPVETLWALFVARCKQVLAKHVPTKLSSRRYNQPWANGKI